MKSGRKSHAVVSCVAFVGIISMATAQQISDTVYFDFDDYALDATEKLKLDRLISASKNPDNKVTYLDGYCDSTGSFQYNLALSERRAHEVLNYLYSRNEVLQCAHFRGHSFHNPVASNSSDHGRSLNRRVVVTLKPSESSKSMLSGGINNEFHKAINGNVQVFDLTDTTQGPRHLLVVGGHYSVSLTPQHNYLIISGATGYFPDFKRLTAVSEHSYTATLNPLKKAATFRIPNMSFVPSEAELLPESLPTLIGLLELMRGNPTLRIQLEGHTNAVRSSHPPQWHQDLSERRTQSIANYLITHGVESSRIRAKGFGSSQMLFSDPSSTRIQLKQNRRVEVRIL